MPVDLQYLIKRAQQDSGSDSSASKVNLSDLIQRVQGYAPNLNFKHMSIEEFNKYLPDSYGDTTTDSSTLPEWRKEIENPISTIIKKGMPKPTIPDVPYHGNINFGNKVDMTNKQQLVDQLHDFVAQKDQENAEKAQKFQEQTAIEQHPIIGNRFRPEPENKTVNPLEATMALSQRSKQSPGYYNSANTPSNPIFDYTKNSLNDLGDIMGGMATATREAASYAAGVKNMSGEKLPGSAFPVSYSYSDMENDLLDSAEKGNQNAAKVYAALYPQDLLSMALTGKRIKDIPVVGKILYGGHTIAGELATDPTSYIPGVGFTKVGGVAKGAEALLDTEKGINAAKDAVETASDVARASGHADDTVRLANGAEKAESAGKSVLETADDVGRSQAAASDAGVLDEIKTKPSAQTPVSADAPLQSVNTSVSTDVFPKTAENVTDLPQGVGAKSAEFVPERKTSKVYTNTFKNTTILDDAEKNLLDPRDYEFDSMSEKQSINEARQRIETDFDGEVKDLSGDRGFQDASDTDTAMGILGNYADEGKKTGNYDDMKNWSKNVYDKSHGNATALQALDKYSRTPEGDVIKAQQAVEGQAEKIVKRKEKTGEIVNTGKGRVIDRKAQLAQDTAKKARESAVNDVVKDVNTGNVKAPVAQDKDAAMMLAQRIRNTVKPKTPEESDMIDRMVNELFSVAKESPIEVAVQGEKTTPLQSVSEAIKYRQKYVDTWNRAKAIIMRDFGTDPKARSILANYFSRGIRPPYSIRNFNSAFNQGMKDLNLKMSQIVKEYYAHGTEDKQGMIDALIQKSGLSGDDARSFADAIDSRFHELKKQYGDKYLKQVFSERELRKAAEPEKTIEALSNTGAFVNKNYTDKVMSKLTPKLRAMVKKSGIDMSELVRQGYGKTELERIKFVQDVAKKLNINDRDMKTVLQSALDEFDSMAEAERSKILNKMLVPTERTAQKKTMYDKVMDLINLGAYDKKEYVDLIRQKEGIPVLTSDDIKGIYEYSDLASKTADEYMQRAYRDKAAQIIARRITSSPKDYVLAVRRIAMLLNPKTLISRNAGGNLLFNVLEDIKDVPGAVIDRAVSHVTGIRTTAAPSLEVAKAKAQGFKKGASELVNDIKYGVDTSSTHHELTQKVFKGDVGGFVEEALNKVMQAGDRPFYESAYSGRIAELKKLGRDVTNESVQNDAKLYALERVFQNDSTMSQGARMLREGVNKITGGVGGNVVMPFTQTPSNIFDKLLDYSPAGYVRAIWKWGKVGESAWSQKKFVDTLARSFTGSGILAIGFSLASHGLITGKRNSNDQVSAAEKLQGKQPYSIYLNGHSYTYDWASPAGSLLAAAADAYNAGVSKQGIMNVILSGAEGASNAFLQQSFFSGLSDALNSNNPAEGIAKTVLGVPAQFAPTGLKQISQVVDPYSRETYSPNPLIKSANQVISKIPGLSMTLQPQIGANGQPIKNFQGRGTASNMFESFISPGYIGENQQTPVDKELYRLYQVTGKPDVLPKDKVDTSVSSGKYQMTAEEYKKYQETEGKTAYEVIANLITLPEYQQLSDKDKASAVSKVYSYAVDQADEQFYNNRSMVYEGDLSTSQQGYVPQMVNQYGLSEKRANDLLDGINALQPTSGRKTVTVGQKRVYILKQQDIPYSTRLAIYYLIYGKKPKSTKTSPSDLADTAISGVN